MSERAGLLKNGIAWIIVAGIVLVVLQVAATLLTAMEVERASRAIATELAKLQSTTLTDEKTRQEVLNLRIQNEIRGLVSNSLLVSIGPIVTAFVALVGALLGLRNFLAAREKDRLDRAAVELKETMDRLVTAEPYQRAAGVLGLQHFLSPDLRDYHLRAASALAMAARIEQDREVLGALRIAVEQAVRTVSEETLRQVSWQAAKLEKARLRAPALREFDFRDSLLNDADFAGCDLSGSRFNNAQLKGARLDHCTLGGADLGYADLAGASLVEANFGDAILLNAKVSGMDIAGADLTRARFDGDALPWELITHWRRAKLDPALRGRLIDRYGAEPSGAEVLMLMWEIAPLVAGGTWTACYHLVRNLRRRGAGITVVVPWSERLITARAFGSEVRVVALGIEPPEWESSSGRAAYSAYGFSPYAPSWSPYGSTRPSSWYSAYEPSWSPYAWLSSYGAAPPRDAAAGPTPSALLRLIDEARRRFVRFARTETFDVIHAHDWVTFDAADAAAKATGKPWIAHFHSLERDRRPQAPDTAIERIEQSAAATAARLVAPSHHTAERIVQFYDVDAGRITIAPNTLSREPIAPAELGLFESGRVLFLGRLTEQKGPDLFAEIAAKVRAQLPDAKFEAHGGGESVAALYKAGVAVRGPVQWTERGRAFGDASALLVPSRAEPFGMVVLEAMQRRVPVLYPRTSGAAEVLQSGLKIDPENCSATAEALVHLLTDRARWEEVAAAQAAEIRGYAERGYEELVRALYQNLTAKAAT